MIQADKLTHIKIEVEKLKTGMEALINKTDALSAILDKIDDLLFRKNGGEKAIIHVLNKHQSFIIEHKDFRSPLGAQLIRDLVTKIFQNRKLDLVDAGVSCDLRDRILSVRVDPEKGHAARFVLFG